MPTAIDLQRYRASSEERAGNAEKIGSVDVLLSIESRIRAIESANELQYFIVNETRRLIPYRQALVFERKGKHYRIKAISSLVDVDRSSEFVIWAEQIVAGLNADVNLSALREFSAHGYTKSAEEKLPDYPYDDGLWLPLFNKREGVFGGVLMLREQPWREQQVLIAQRLSEAYSHALSAIRLSKRYVMNTTKVVIRTTVLGACVLASLLFLTVPMTTLAPMEVVAAEPQIIAAPLSGVINDIVVEQNTYVEKDTLLIRFEDTDLRNRFHIAEQDVRVASARLRQARQSAFSSADQSHQVAILETELKRGQLEMQYAQEQLKMSELRAPVAGLVIYSSKNDWIGKPVSVGERILTIADPNKLEFQVNVPVQDAIVLEKGARVKTYLDADPLSPIESTIHSASYHAQAMSGQSLAYKVMAKIGEHTDTSLRIGLQGTAKVYGEDVSVFFYLFRRPIAWTRQFFGL